MDTIRKRRSVRQFLPQPVEPEKIMLCLEAARLSPSACNIQPWKFIVVDDKELISRIDKDVFSGVYSFNKHATKAPVLVVVVAEPNILVDRIFSNLQGTQYWLLDIGASIEQFILQATELGLGSCWIGWFNERRLKKILGIPRSKTVAAMISLGYFNEDVCQPKKPKKNLDEIHSFNRY